MLEWVAQIFNQNPRGEGRGAMLFGQYCQRISLTLDFIALLLTSFLQICLRVLGYQNLKFSSNFILGFGPVVVDVNVYHRCSRFRRS
jgi:hypothetical protein